MTVGVTGHQNLDVYDRNWIYQSLQSFLLSRKIEMGYSSLAIGADQLFVKILIEFKIDFGVIIPCRHYEKTFKEKNDLDKYYSLRKKAKEAYTLNFDEPDEKAFYEAGIKILEMSDVMLAVWNGKKAKGFGGTGDIVEAAIQNKKNVFHINPVNKTIQML